MKTPGRIDLNDLVVGYNWELYTQAGSLERALLSLIPVASGGIIDTGLADSRR